MVHKSFPKPQVSHSPEWLLFNLEESKTLDNSNDLVKVNKLGGVAPLITDPRPTIFTNFSKQKRGKRKKKITNNM